MALDIPTVVRTGRLASSVYVVIKDNANINKDYSSQISSIIGTVGIVFS